MILSPPIVKVALLVFLKLELNDKLIYIFLNLYIKMLLGNYLLVNITWHMKFTHEKYYSEYLYYTIY